MMKRLSTALLAMVFAALIAVPLAGNFAPKAVYAVDAKKEICEGLGGSGDGNCQVSGAPSLEGTIKRIVDILSLVAAIVAVVVIIIGGFIYVTSGGDSGKVSSAKNTIIYAIVGLIIVAVSQVIVKFVLDRVL